MNIRLISPENKSIPITLMRFENDQGGYIETTGNDINEYTKYLVPFLNINIEVTNLTSHHSRFNFSLTKG